MKTFNEYLTESKKVYSFNVKVAGEVPEGFCDRLKSCMASREVVTCEEMSKTPVTEVPMDFPELNNMEVTTFNLVTSYPITPQEVLKMTKEKAHYYMTTNIKKQVRSNTKITLVMILTNHF